MIRIKRYIYDYLPAFAAFFIAFSLTVVAFFQLRNWIIEKNKNIFQEQTVQATEKIISRMNEYIQVLKAGRGLFASQDTITRKEWENFYRNIDLEKNYPGIQGIGYAAYLRSETEVEVLESKVKKEGISWFEVLPEGKRNIYCPILFLEPLTWRNQRALGFDMFSEIARRNAMEHARDSMQPTLSSIVTLVQETSENVQNGFLLYLPVYRYKIQQPENIQDRQRSIKGFIYSPFRARDLFNGIFQNRFREMDITLTGIDEKGAQQILYKSVKDSNKLDENQLIKVSYLNIAEQTWKVVYKTNSSFGTITDKIQPILVLLAGTVISFLLFFLFWFFMKIRRANRVLNTVTSNATAALFMVNKQGNCTFINQSAERMLGFSREEYKTMKFDILISESKRSGVKPSQIPFIGSTIKNLEDVFIRKDGTTVNVSISSKPVYDGFELVSTIIEVRDISEEKHAEEKIKSINEDLSKKNQELNKINTDLDNFIYTASHDLKAPVSNIEGLVNALEDVQKEQGSEPKEIVNLIKKSIIRFKNTIQDLTDISKIQKNFEIYQEFINVDTVINEVMDDLKFPLEESGGEIIKELKEKTLFFSKPNLKSIIYNLISNAIKYRKPNQKLICHIRFYSEGNKIILEVEDNGLGIPKNLQDKVFGMFKRVHTHVEGSGIGLYIVKRMVENGGARIELYSDEGLGCKFRIIFDKNVN